MGQVIRIYAQGGVHHDFPNTAHVVWDKESHDATVYESQTSDVVLAVLFNTVGWRKV